MLSLGVKVHLAFSSSIYSSPFPPLSPLNKALRVLPKPWGGGRWTSLPCSWWAPCYRIAFPDTELGQDSFIQEGASPSVPRSAMLHCAHTLVWAAGSDIPKDRTCWGWSCRQQVMGKLRGVLKTVRERQRSAGSSNMNPAEEMKSWSPPWNPQSWDLPQPGDLPLLPCWEQVGGLKKPHALGTVCDAPALWQHRSSKPWIWPILALWGVFLGATILFCMQDEVLCYQIQDHPYPCQTQAPQPLSLSLPRTFS